METETWAGAGTNDAHSGTWWLNLVLHQRHSRRPCRLPWGGGGGGRQELGLPLPEPPPPGLAGGPRAFDVGRAGGQARDKAGLGARPLQASRTQDVRDSK